MLANLPDHPRKAGLVLVRRRRCDAVSASRLVRSCGVQRPAMKGVETNMATNKLTKTPCGVQRPAMKGVETITPLIDAGDNKLWSATTRYEGCGDLQGIH